MMLKHIELFRQVIIFITSIYIAYTLCELYAPYKENFKNKKQRKKAKKKEKKQRKKTKKKEKKERKKEKKKEKKQKKKKLTLIDKIFLLPKCIIPYFFGFIEYILNIIYTSIIPKTIRNIIDVIYSYTLKIIIDLIYDFTGYTQKKKQCY